MPILNLNKLSLRVMLTISLVGLIWTPGCAQEAVSLLAGQSLERVMTDGAAHRFQFTLAAGQYAEFSFEHQGVTLAAAITGPDGQPLSAWAVDNVPESQFELGVLAASAGVYELTLRAQDEAPRNGRYKLLLKFVRAATTADQQSFEAQRLFAKATRLYRQRTAESRRQALTWYRAALPHWRAAGKPELEGRVLLNIALTHRQLGELRLSLNALREAMAFVQSAGLSKLELEALIGLASLHQALGEYQSAQEIARQSLTLSRTLQMRQAEMVALSVLSLTSAVQGRLREAISFDHEVLQLARATGQRAGEAQALSNLGSRFAELGEPQQAVDNYQQALRLYHTLGRSEAEAATLGELGVQFFQQGAFQQGLDHLQQALKLMRVSGKRDKEADLLNRLGRAWLMLGERAQAHRALTEALTLSRGNGYRAEEAESLRLLGRWHREAEAFAPAQESLTQALAISRTVGARPEIAEILRELGTVAAIQNHDEVALTYLAESLALSRELGLVRTQGYALLHAGRVQRKTRAQTQAAALLAEALTLSRQHGDQLLEAAVLRELAQLDLQQGRSASAATHLAAALKLLEAARATLFSPDLRAMNRGNVYSYYELYVESLLRQFAEQGDERLAVQAFDAVEHARARTLLESLAEARIDWRSGVHTALLAHERDLRERLAAKAERLQRLELQLAEQPLAQTLHVELDALSLELREVEARIREASPAYAALTQVQPLTLAALQQQILDDQTLLLEYSLGKERSYLFAVSKTELRVFALPPRAELEQDARRWYELLTAFSHPPVFTSIQEKILWQRQQERAQQAVAARLGQKLLAPVKDLLTRQRLLIVPDGLLHYVPFAALPISHSSSVATAQAKEKQPPANQRQPLIARHEILTLPSASTLAVLRREVKGRAPAPQALALLADPVFAREDERVRLTSLTAKSSPPPTEVLSLFRQEPDSELRRPLERLPATRSEAAAVSALVPAAEKQLAFDFDASRAWVLKTDLSRYRYLHFATHGLLNNTRPALSGLALSLVDQEGREQDGFLRLLDIYHLQLNAELVTLSGCHTALGREVSGEGLIGLTRGFLSAGARRVVASLWQVNDVATAELMRRFYQGMLGKKKLSPAAALRAAQLSLRQEPRWQSPFFWAAFTIQGEW